MLLMIIILLKKIFNKIGTKPTNPVIIYFGLWIITFLIKKGNAKIEKKIIKNLDNFPVLEKIPLILAKVKKFILYELW